MLLIRVLLLHLLQVLVLPPPQNREGHAQREDPDGDLRKGRGFGLVFVEGKKKVHKVGERRREGAREGSEEGQTRNLITPEGEGTEGRGGRRGGKWKPVPLPPK